MPLNNFQLSKNFNLNEFECHCCHHVMIESSLVTLLQKLRDKLGVPMRVTSGYRCEKHNYEVGGVNNSRHCVGRAADVAVKCTEQKNFCSAAHKIGFVKVLPYPDKNFVHLEVF